MGSAPFLKHLSFCVWTMGYHSTKGAFGEPFHTAAIFFYLL
jgi:hypothetical protein